MNRKKERLVEVVAKIRDTIDDEDMDMGMVKETVMCLMLTQLRNEERLTEPHAHAIVEAVFAGKMIPGPMARQ